MVWVGPMENVSQTLGHHDGKTAGREMLVAEAVKILPCGIIEVVGSSPHLRGQDRVVAAGRSDPQDVGLAKVLSCPGFSDILKDGRFAECWVFVVCHPATVVTQRPANIVIHRTTPAGFERNSKSGSERNRDSSSPLSSVDTPSSGATK